MQAKWWVLTISIVLAIGVAILIQYFKVINDKKYENVTYHIVCTDMQDNRIFDSNMKYASWGVSKGNLYIYNGERAGDTYTCNKLTWVRTDNVKQ